MALSYEEALATLQSMFAEPWTRETLDAVLRHQKGHMENTVDFILRHSNKDPQHIMEQLHAGINPDDSTLQLDAELARQLSQSALVGGGGAGAAAGSRGGRPNRGTVTQLPEDFLRVPGFSATQLQQHTLESDAALARMLQDEMFSNQVAASHPDLAQLARSGRLVAGGPLPPAQRSVSRTNFPGLGAFVGGGGAANNNNNPNENNLLKKINELGDNAKKRLQILAAQFQARNAGGAGGIMGEPAQQTAAHERRGLLDDADDEGMEFAHRGRDA